MELPVGRCRVCLHPQRQEIEEAIVRRVSMETIARTYNLGTEQPVYDHKQNHLSQEVQAALAESEKHRMEHILDLVMHQTEELKEIFDFCRASGQFKLALNANRELIRNLAFFGAMTVRFPPPGEAIDTETVFRKLLPEAFEPTEPEKDDPLTLDGELVDDNPMGIPGFSNRRLITAFEEKGIILTGEFTPLEEPAAKEGEPEPAVPSPRQPQEVWPIMPSPPARDPRLSEPLPGVLSDLEP